MICFGTIPKNTQIARLDTTHDERYSRRGETKIMESEFQEVPIKPIICLFKINFERNRALFCTRMMYEMNNLLGQDGIISSTSTWDEATLKRAYQVNKKRSQATNQHFCDYLKNDITKADGSKIL